MKKVYEIATLFELFFIVSLIPISLSYALSNKLSIIIPYANIFLWFISHVVKKCSGYKPKTKHGDGLGLM